MTQERTKPIGRRAEAVTAPSEEQILLARSQGRVTFSDEDALALTEERADEKVKSARVRHTRPDLVRVYKPTPWGYFPRNIPVTNLSLALANGFKVSCPDCGENCGTDPNSCKGRTPRAYRICPVAGCGKKIYDYQIVDEKLLLQEEETDPNLIRDDAYIQATPELRTKAALDLHLRAYHPVEATAAGLTMQGVR